MLLLTRTVWSFHSMLVSHWWVRMFFSSFSFFTSTRCWCWTDAYIFFYRSGWCLHFFLSLTFVLWGPWGTIRQNSYVITPFSGSIETDNTKKNGSLWCEFPFMFLLTGAFAFERTRSKAYSFDWNVFETDKKIPETFSYYWKLELHL